MQLYRERASSAVVVFLRHKQLSQESIVKAFIESILPYAVRNFDRVR